MALAAPLFADPILFYIQLVILVAALVTEVVAFVSCLTQRPDAFQAISTLPKGMWLALLGGSMLVSLLLASPSPVGIFGMIALSAALVYLVDIRPALRDAVNGTGSW
jgi:hypothetical protein